MQLIDPTTPLPLGASPFGIVPRKENPRKRPNLLKIAVVMMVITALLLAGTTTAFAAKTGYWKIVTSTPISGTGDTSTATTNKIFAQFIDSSTEKVVDEKTINRPATEKQKATIKYLNENCTPDGYSTSATTTDDDDSGSSGGGGSSGSSSTESDEGSKIIAENDPEFALSFTFVGHSIAKVMWSLMRGAAAGMISLGEWFLGIVDMHDLFTEDFATGAYSPLYTVAQTIAMRVGVPFGTAFLGVTFGVAMVRNSDQRRRNKAMDWGHSMLFLLLGFAVAWTLIYHAIDIMAALYWMGTQFVVYVERALEAVGVSSSMGEGLGSAMSDAILTKGFDTITYDGAGTMFVWALFGFITPICTIGCGFFVIFTAFMRMVEIYLRASFASIPMSFFMAESTRHMGWTFLKRFGAVCFQAGVIVLAVAFLPLLYGISASVLSNVISSADGLQAGLATILPLWIAVSGMTAIVKKSESIANGLFGLAG